MLVIFVHGWSVTNTDTYGALPSAVTQYADPSLAIQVTDLYLGKYISFRDEVNIDDIARGMQQAVTTEVLPRLSSGERFACVTHSTGGPVVRKWVDLFFKEQLADCPLSHLIMLAPANHGSALAQLGKGRLSRMKFFAEGVQPGVGVLNWLELGSDQSWKLNSSWLDYSCTSSGMYVFVLTGQTIDHKLYDHLNSYTGEVGSDGVVRAAAANMNYGFIRLVQHDGKFKLDKQKQLEKYAFGILPGRSHSDGEIGIMGSVKIDEGPSNPTVNWLLQCLTVSSAASYKKVSKALADLSDQTQAEERSRKTKELFLFEREFITSRYCMLVFRIEDDRDNSLADYDLFFTAGPNYDKNHLPEGFFVDRQRNLLNPGKLTYYIDYDKMSEWLAKPELQGKFGFKLVARPASGYAYYVVAEHRGTFNSLKQFFEPNQTLMVEIQLTRYVSEGVFRLTQKLVPESFKDQLKGPDLP
jgi:hypothetical protein